MVTLKVARSVHWERSGRNLFGFFFRRRTHEVQERGREEAKSGDGQGEDGEVKYDDQSEPGHDTADEEEADASDARYEFVQVLLHVESLQFHVLFR